MQEMTVQVFVRTQLFHIRQRKTFELFGIEYVCFIIIKIALRKSYFGDRKRYKN